MAAKKMAIIATSPLANPAMPMPVSMPVIVSVLPGGAATSMKFAGETDVCLFI